LNWENVSSIPSPVKLKKYEKKDTEGTIMVVPLFFYYYYYYIFDLKRTKRSELVTASV